MSQRRRRTPALPALSADYSRPLFPESFVRSSVGSRGLTSAQSSDLFDDFPAEQTWLAKARGPRGAENSPLGNRTFAVLGASRSSPDLVLGSLGASRDPAKPRLSGSLGALRPASSASSLGLRPTSSASSLSQVSANVYSKGLPRLRKVREKHMDPNSMNFSELTSGVPVSERVRWIPQVENRGVMVKQLELLVDFIDMRRNSKTDAISGWVDEVTGEQLYFQTINLHQVLYWIVKPLTSPAKCSYVEAVTLAVEYQVPHWFASHWWGASFGDFAASIKGHATIRYPDLSGVTSSYWVCAFARNQHVVESDLSCSLVHASFFRALRECVGIVLVLDSTSPAAAFKRTWCCYELSMAVQHLSHLSIDLAVVDGEGTAQVLTEGLTNEEDRMEETRRLGGAGLPSGWNVKAKREAGFPVGIVKNGLKLKVAETEATADHDKSSILSALAKRDPRDPLDLEDPAFDEVDRRLRARLGSITLRQAIQQREDLSKDTGLGIADAIAEDPTADRLELNLSSCWKMTNKDIQHVARAFPAEGAMRGVAFNFKDCYQMSSVQALLGKVVSAVDRVREVVFDFSDCTGLRSTEEFVAFASALASDVSSPKAIRSMRLDFNGCDNLGPLDAMVEELMKAQIKNLTVIDPSGANIAVQKVVAEDANANQVRAKKKSKKDWQSKTAKQAWAKRNSKKGPAPSALAR